jgi:hypothetical protein
MAGGEKQKDPGSVESGSLKNKATNQALRRRAKK